LKGRGLKLAHKRRRINRSLSRRGHSWPAKKSIFRSRSNAAKKKEPPALRLVAPSFFSSLF